MKLKTLVSLSVLGSLLGCSSTPRLAADVSAVSVPHKGVPSKVHAAPEIKAARTLVEGLYATARQAHAGGQLGAAAQGYERVLSLQPEHAGALNALGVIRAQDGRNAEALELFTKAREQDPSAAHVHNNLGYALLLEKRLDEAKAALKLALELQPDSAQTLRNLELLAQARAEQVAAQADAPAPVSAPVSFEPTTVPQVPAIMAVAPNVFELRLSNQLGSVPTAQAGVSPDQAASDPVEVATVVPADLPEPGYKLVLSRELALQSGPFAIWTDIRGVKLEVSNGVGISRLAKRTAMRLAESGVATARLTNARPYRQERTQIQYLPGQKSAVQALAARLPMPVELVQVDQLQAKVHLRLVLGHDVAGHAIAAWLDKPTTQVAAQPVEPASPSASARADSGAQPSALLLIVT